MFSPLSLYLALAKGGGSAHDRRARVSAFACAIKEQRQKIIAPTDLPICCWSASIWLRLLLLLPDSQRPTNTSGRRRLAGRSAAPICICSLSAASTAAQVEAADTSLVQKSIVCVPSAGGVAGAGRLNSHERAKLHPPLKEGTQLNCSRRSGKCPNAEYAIM